MLLVAVLGGCANPFGGVMSLTMLAKHSSRIDEGNYAGALDLMREEIKSPSIGGTTYASNIRVLATNDLASVAKQEGKIGLWAEPAYDAEALRWFLEGQALGKGDTDQTDLVFSAYANYLSNTGRAGASIPFRILGINFLKRRNPEQAIAQLRLAAEALEQAGDQRMGNLLKLTFYQTFIEINPKLKAEQSLSLLQTELVPMLDSSAGPTEADVDKAWAPMAEMETKCPACDPVMIIPKLLMAKAYARRGAAAPARRMRDQAVASLAKSNVEVMRKVGATMQVCLDVMIFAAERNYSAVARANLDCKRVVEANGAEQALGLESVDRNYYLDLALATGESAMQAGQAPEAARAFGEAITLIERSRAIFDVSQLSQFYANPRIRRAYEGMLRAQVTIAGAKPGVRDRDRTLNVAELSRARQLREMRARRAGQAAKSAAFDVEAYLGDDSRISGLLKNLPPKSAMLYYIAFDDRLLAIAIDARGFDIVAMPVSREQLHKLVNDAASQLARPRDAAAADRALVALSRAILDPLEKRIGAATTLVVVPDEALNRVPFSNLSLGAKKRVQLVESRAVLLLPALDLLGGTPATTREPSILALGDPKYPDFSTDPAVTRAVQMRSIDGKSQAVPVFSPLPETRGEVEAIAARFPLAQRHTLLGPDASEAQLKREPLETFRYIHLATHGVLGGDIPGVDEPALAMGAGDGQDGLLRASEVVPLKLNARLAVLSACDTGAGNFAQGEGVLGMGRAFLVAGSDAVVMSLWPVASNETAELMKMFYAKLDSGLSQPEALRSAMIGVRAQRGHPFYWAPFVLMGRP
ncbi:hypothetical protein BH10PSE17_BH10PSE17_16750 [soil metagenome]